MLNNQYNSKYLNVKKVVKNDGNVAFLEKDHLNAVEDVVLFEDTVIGQRTETSGTDLLTIVKHIGEDATVGTSAVNSISVNGVQQTADAQRNVNVTVPDELKDLADDSTHRVVTDAEKQVWNDKQDALSFESDNYDETTNKVVCKSDLTSAVAGLTGATHFRGKFDSVASVANPQNGDVVIIGSKEYIYSDECDPVWNELGDETIYAVKGNIKNDDIASDAAIAQSKVAGLTDALEDKVSKETGKSLVADTEVAKIHEHNNKDTLDSITDEAWSNVVSNSNLVSTKVSTTTTVAGIDLADNITADELKTALDVPSGSLANKDNVSVGDLANDVIDKFDTKQNTIPTEPTTCETVQSTGTFYDIFCNGVPVVVEQGDTQDDIVVYYDNRKKNITVNKGSYKGIRVYGGCNDLGFPTYLPATSIIVNSGVLNSLYAGSINSGKVGNATIVMNGGTITGGVAAGRSDGQIKTSLHDNVVGNYKVVVNNANENTYIIGGSGGYSTVNNSNVVINGGTGLYVLASSANGNSINSNLVVNGGSIKELYTVNRGYCANTKVTVNKGTVTKFYVGADETPDQAKGNFVNYDNLEINLLGGTVANLVTGYNYLTKEVTKVHGTYKTGVVTTDSDNIQTARLTKITDAIESIELNGTTLTVDSNKKATGLVKSTLPLPDNLDGNIRYQNGEDPFIDTTLEFCQTLCQDSNCKVGVIYCGYVRLRDAPCDGCEITVSVMKDESEGYGSAAKVLVLHMNSTGHHEKSWITMYHYNQMKYGTNSCPWETTMLMPVNTSASAVADDYIGASKKYIDDADAKKIESITINDCDLTFDSTTKKASGNVKPFQTFLDTWPTENKTMAELCTAIAQSEQDGLVHVGSYFMGEIAYMDPMPIGIGNAEVTMYVPTDGVYVFTMTSTTTSPYHWEADGQASYFSGWRQVLTIKEPTTAGKYIACMEAKDEEELYEAKVKWQKDTKVENTTTIAGVDLVDNITADELKTALGTQDLTFTFADSTTKTLRFVCSEVTA